MRHNTINALKEKLAFYSNNTVPFTIVICYLMTNHLFSCLTKSFSHSVRLQPGFSPYLFINVIIFKNNSRVNGQDFPQMCFKV